MKPWDFARLTFREYILMVRGYERVQTRQSEHTRMITYTIAAANRNPEKPFPSLHDFWPLSSDESEKEKQKEDATEFYNKMMNRLANKFPKHVKAQA